MSFNATFQAVEQFNAQAAKVLEIGNGATRHLGQVDTALQPYRDLVNLIDAAIAPVATLNADIQAFGAPLK